MSKNTEPGNYNNLIILLAIEDVSLANVIFSYLKDIGFKQIIPIKSTREAFSKCKEDESIDLVIVDWRQTDNIDGLTLVNLLRTEKENPRLNSLPVLVLITKNYINETIQSGANGYLLKPFNQQTFLDKIIEILSKNNFQKISPGFIKATFEVVKEIHPANNPLSILDECH